MKKINLIYWDSDNLGDVLSPYIVEKLSGLPTQHKNPNLKRDVKVKIILKAFLTFSFKEFRSILWPWQKTLLAIGSILDWGNRRSTIWGSGFMNKNNHTFVKNICAVRGKYTLNALSHIQFDKIPAFGDPALLLPMLLPREEETGTDIAIIPHWKEVDYFIEKYSTRYKIIDFRTRDVKKIKDEICSCKYILSSSLHGIILGHAYNVPSLWIKNGFVDTDGFKFYDYFSSIGIPEYDGFDYFDQILKSNMTVENHFNTFHNFSLPNVDLKDLQQALLKSAPFPVLDKYLVNKI